MNNQFDEMTKSLAQSVTRRAALKKFSVGLAGMALACFGLANKARADQNSCNACLKGCFALYESQGVSHKDAALTCESQCALPCMKKPF